MHDQDCLHRFLFEHYPIRGHLVHLDAAWCALLEHQQYPSAIRDTLGEAVAASVLLAATLKFDGLLSLQLRGRGPMHLMVAQCSSEFGVRGVARFTEAMSTKDLAMLSGDGNLTVTLETENLAQRYQGIVPLSGNSLAECLQGYFQNSEQLPTRLWLHADASGVSGMLLQRLPADSVARRDGVSSESLQRAADLDEVDDVWRRVQMLGDSLKVEELRTLRDHDILRRLFAQDDVRLFESSPVFFRCRCSRERVSGMLQSLGADEIRSVLAEQGRVEVTCDFCNRAYVFDAVDVAQLFAEGTHGSSGTIH
jgi:molecular chaperone Hsp33